MALEEALTPRFEMGRVVNRTFGAIGRNFVVFGALALILAGLPLTLLEWATLDRPIIGSQFGLSWTTVDSLAMLIATSVLEAALIQGTLADLSGRRADFGECLSTGLRHFAPVLAIGVLSAVAVF